MFMCSVWPQATLILILILIISLRWSQATVFSPLSQAVRALRTAITSVTSIMRTSGVGCDVEVPRVLLGDTLLV